MKKPKVIELELDPHLKEIVSALEANMGALYQRAFDLADEYNQFSRESNRRLDWADKGTLQLRVRQRGSSMTAEWYEVRWYGSKAKGTRQPFSTYIAKPKTGYGYTLTKLKSYAQPWEEDKLDEVEGKLNVIRRQAKFVMKAISCLKDTIPQLPAKGEQHE